MRGRWGRLGAGCLVMAMIGFIYGWSVLSAPLSAEFGWAPSALSFTFTLLMWAFCAGGIIGGRLVRRMAARTVLWLAATITLCAFASTALLARSDVPWVLYLTYGVLGGTGVGIAYTAAMGSVMAWFSDRAGLASGLMLLCYCLSTLALSSVATWLFGIIGWRLSYLALGVGTSAVVMAAACALRYPREGEAGHDGRSVGDEGASTPIAADADAAPVRGLTTAAMLCTPVFWAYAAWMVLVSCIGLAVIGSANQLALGAGATTTVAVAAVGALSVCNGLGRLLMGVVFDAAGTAWSTLICATLLLGCAVLLAGAVTLGSVPLALAGIVCGGLGAGSTSVIGSGFVATVYGEAHYAENLAVLNLALIPAALAGPLVLSVPLTMGGGYVPGLAALAGLAAGAIALGVALRRLIARTAN